MTESEDAYVNSKAITVFQYFQMLRKALHQWTGQTLECPTQFEIDHNDYICNYNYHYIAELKQKSPSLSKPHRQ